MTAPNLLVPSEYARGAVGAALHRLPGVAAAVYVPVAGQR
jgi:hypothetical protein